MYNRHNEVPVYDCRDGVIEAERYNRVQTAFKRLGEEIRLVIPRLKMVELLLQRDAWIIVDRALHDLPIAAWTDFDVAGRDALHAPVPCKVKLYHSKAGVILDRVLEMMDCLLTKRLSNKTPSHRVISITGKK